MKYENYELSGAKGEFEKLIHNETNFQCLIYQKQYHDIIDKYYNLAILNPENKTWYDIVAYIYVKIMFEHPLVDGNKRLAMWVLLTGLDIAINFSEIEAICKSLAKEVR